MAARNHKFSAAKRLAIRLAWVWGRQHAPMTLELLAELMGVSIASARKLVSVLPRKSAGDEALAAIKALWLTESGYPVAEWLPAHGAAVCFIAERLIAIREPSTAEGWRHE